MRLIDADDFGNRMYYEAFEKDTDMQRWDSGCWIRFKLFENVLREQPTVEPEQKTGHWINSYKRQTCSICKQRGYRSWNFCPNCGADMREENES